MLWCSLTEAFWGITTQKDFGSKPHEELRGAAPQSGLGRSPTEWLGAQPHRGVRGRSPRRKPPPFREGVGGGRLKSYFG